MHTSAKFKGHENADDFLAFLFLREGIGEAGRRVRSTIKVVTVKYRVLKTITALLRSTNQHIKPRQQSTTRSRACVQNSISLHKGGL